MQPGANATTRPFITFLLVTGRLHPSWDYLVRRKFPAIWRDLPGTVIATGKRLHKMTDADFQALRVAGLAQRADTGRTWRHYRASATNGAAQPCRGQCLEPQQSG